MENQFAVTVHEFFMAQDEQTRLGILEYYTHDPPNQMYLLWAASHDERLSTNARKASVILDTFFLSNRNNFISFELAHRQAAKLFKRFRDEVFDRVARSDVTLMRFFTFKNLITVQIFNILRYFLRFA